ncbi:hypothetical protein ACTXT7_002921, partial [Hymenolepis weldensis]
MCHAIPLRLLLLKTKRWTINISQIILVEQNFLELTQNHSETELTEAFMDKWVIVGITCGVILGVIVIVTIVSLL